MAQRTYYNSGGAGRDFSRLKVIQFAGVAEDEDQVVDIVISPSSEHRDVILSREQAEDLGTQLLLAAGVELIEEPTEGEPKPPMIEGESFTLLEE